MERITYLDHLKGMAILIVVIGHVLQYCVLPQTFNDDRLWNIIYSFHMSLFMMVSGYVMQMRYKSKIAPPQTNSGEYT